MSKIYIREWRKKIGLSQSQLAETIGVDTATVSRWERGVVALTSKQILKLCEIFEIKTPQLYAAPEDAVVVENLETAYKIIKNLDKEGLKNWLEVGKRMLVQK